MKKGSEINNFISFFGERGKLEHIKVGPTQIKPHINLISSETEPFLYYSMCRSLFFFIEPTDLWEISEMSSQFLSSS